MRLALVAIFLVFFLSLTLLFDSLRHRSVIEQAYSQVVVVTCDTGYGTGWFINREYIVTAYHVVDCCNNIYAVRYPWMSPLELYVYDSVRDIAILRVANPPSWARGLPLAFSVTIGDNVWVVGYPVQLFQESNENISRMSIVPRIARGAVSWLHPYEPIFQFDAETDTGNSGGPVVSEKGVVGLVVYARPGIVSAGYFGLRMDYVSEFLSRNNIDYSVAGGYSWLLLLGIGIVIILVVGGKHG